MDNTPVRYPVGTKVIYQGAIALVVGHHTKSAFIYYEILDVRHQQYYTTCASYLSKV